MNPITIEFVRTLPAARMPVRGSAHAAGYDLIAADKSIDLATGIVVVDTGLRTSFPEGYVLKVFSRSGWSRKHGIVLVNGTGIIDADYRGQLLIMLKSDRMAAQDLYDLIQIGDRVAQCILEEIPAVEWQETESLVDTVRSVGGFGSTGR